jgi:hypothetical protein
MCCSDPDKFFTDDPQAIALWRDYLVDRGAVSKDGIVFLMLTNAGAHPRASYAASLARKRPDLFLVFSTQRRLTR